MVAEKIISAYSPVLDSSYYTSSYLRNADLKFDNIKNENGKEIELTESNYSIYIRSKDRNVRKNTFNTLYKGYKGLENTLTSTYNTTVTNDSITSRLRKYNSSIEMYLKPKNIPVKLYNNLIKVVRDNLDTLYPNNSIEPLSKNISRVIDLNVVVFPEPLYPIRPKCSFFSKFKFKLLTALTFFPRQTKYVLYKFLIFVVKF